MSMAPSYPRRKPDDQTCPHADPRLGHRRREHEGGQDRPAGSAAGPGRRRCEARRCPSRSSGIPTRSPRCSGRSRPELGHAEGWPHAVTMTAELSQAFRTKRQGVAFVLGALARAFPADPRARLHGGRPVRDAGRGRRRSAGRRQRRTGRRRPRSSRRFVPDGILVDIGTTSTDIIPIEGGRVAARGRTDPARLLSRELVYTGAVRTPAEALLREVPLWGGRAGVSAEGFATDRRRARVAGAARTLGLHGADGRRPARRRASSPASGWRASSAATARCSTRRPSTPSPGRSPRPRSSSWPTASAGSARASLPRRPRW